jgi:succinoglycan biosynthesis transport protein ExoP
MNEVVNAPADLIELPTAQNSQGLLAPILVQYWHMALRWRWLVAGIIAGALMIGVVATLFMAPLYTAKVQVQIDRQQKQITKVEGLDAQTATQDTEFYATQYELLKTRPLAERVASELGLYKSRAFLEAHGLNADLMSRKVPGKSEAQLRDEHKRLVVGLLLENIDIAPIRTSKLVDVFYTSRDAELSTAISNKWASSFIALSMDRQFASTSDARTFLEQRLASLRDKVEQSERAVILYGSNADIVNLDQLRDSGGRTMGNRTLAGASLEQLSQVLNVATAARIEAQARAGGGGDTTAEATSSATLAGLRQQRAAASAEYAKLSVQFEPAFPAVRQYAEQIRAIDTAIARETSRIGEARKREYREAQKRESVLKTKVEQLKGDLDRQNRANIQYNIYQREADTNRQLYDALLQRYKEIGVAGSVGVNNIAIVEPAIVH